MIETLSNHNHKDVVWICVVFESFTKNGSNGELWWNDVLVQVLYGFECLFMSINVWTNIGNKFGYWGFKIGILEWKWSFIWELTVIARHGEQIGGHGEWWNVQLAMASDEMSSSPWRVMKCPARHGEWFGGHGELLSSATHIFVVFGADPSFLKCFFQHVWSLFLLFNLLEHLMDWDWLDFVNWTWLWRMSKIIPSSTIHHLTHFL